MFSTLFSQAAARLAILPACSGPWAAVLVPALAAYLITHCADEDGA